MARQLQSKESEAENRGEKELDYVEKGREGLRNRVSKASTDLGERNGNVQGGGKQYVIENPKVEMAALQNMD